ncbi:iron chelate uptake ABC transporter family permease subunit [Paracoccus sp. IB05]|nr:iron chelate uptake ABC transporter family permease subunit [Paracoccus sp. IB05]
MLDQCSDGRDERGEKRAHRLSRPPGGLYCLWRLIDGDPRDWLILWESRVPRTLALVLSGASMAIAGLLMQIVIRNRYVEPSTTGTVEAAVYFALQRIQRTLMPEIEKRLRKMGIQDPIWYEILEAAELAGDEGVRMLALQRRLFVPQYALSRHVSRMVKAGLITREASGDAGRAQIIRLAPAGTGITGGIWDVCVDLIHKAFGPRISRGEAYPVLRMLNRLYD